MIHRTCALCAECRTESFLGVEERELQTMNSTRFRDEKKVAGNKNWSTNLPRCIVHDCAIDAILDKQIPARRMVYSIST